MLLFSLSTEGFGQDISKAMSFNIRYATKNDGVNQWENRKKELVGLIKKHDPDVIGFQEVLLSQLTFLIKNNSEFNKIGVARGDGKEKGEFSPILFNSKKFDLIESNTFWLSESPNNPSIGWDAAHKRICSYVKLRYKSSQNTLWVFNTHFDHIGEKSKKNSAFLIIKKIKTLVSNKDNVILMGDFNSYPETLPITKIKTYFEDGLTVSKKSLKGPFGTFNGFSSKQKLDKNRIDYIFTKNIKVLSYVHIDDKMKNSNFISDHFPVLITFENK